MTIPFSFLSYCEDNPDRGRWDQAWVTRILNGEEGHPPGFFEFEEIPWEPEADRRGRVIVFPAGHYHEHGEISRTLVKLTRDLKRLDWAVIIATSDECQTFPWHKIEWQNNWRLWVMLHKPDHTYPPGTRFIGEGSPHSPQEMAAHAAEDWEKTIDVFFSGQINHERRVQMWETLGPMRDGRLRVSAQATGGFTQGLEPDEYMRYMTSSSIVPCPSGVCSQSSFRVYEALEAQATPVVDEVPPGGTDDNYWHRCGLGFLPSIKVWENFRPMPDDLLRHPEEVVWVQSQWQQYKRRTLQDLASDIEAVADADDVYAPIDMVTVIIPTSPTPSNPDISLIVDTISSVRERLPEAEILITCDGLREEQADRATDYYEYLRRLCAWTNTQRNITPFVYPNHRHQSGMMKAILPEIRTRFLLYVEHDAPLIGEIDFYRMVEMMLEDGLSSLRFMHEARIQDGHEHLFFHDIDNHGHPWIATSQWSQRPHLARTGWYHGIMDNWFGAEARTFIEDVMHGVVQHGVYAARKQPLGGWEAFHMAVYAPEGDMKRSTHTDGRGSDPKYPMIIRYDNGRPEGAPPEGEM